MRGKPSLDTYRNNCRGITPAGAGKTLEGVEVDSTLKDHPRRCGENRGISTITLTKLGSPPQVRGKLTAFDGQPLELGITPAGAGKTVAVNRRDKDALDHPRRCGENPRSANAHRCP